MNSIKPAYESKIKIPSLPSIALRVLDAVQDDKMSFTKLEKIISSDPGLAARALKQANSSFYGLKHRVENVKGAISILGTNALKNIALSFILSDMFSGDCSSHFNFKQFWKKSLTTAVAAQSLAPLLGHEDEGFFITGLLQDIGVVILHMSMPEVYEKVLEAQQANGYSLIESERKLFGIDHQGLASKVLKSWGLPTNIYLPIRYHHNAENAPRQLKNHADVLSWSDLVSSFFHETHQPERLSEVKAQLGDTHGVSNETIEKMLDSVAANSTEIISSFDIDTASIKSYTEILQDANEELSKVNLSYEQLTIELKKSKAEVETLYVELRKKNSQLKRLVVRDGLTGLFNHRHFHECMDTEIERVKRYHTQLSLILFDVDNFKEINDEFGHQTGDRVLRYIGSITTKIKRRTDSVYRYGGDEFAIILTQTDLKGALIFAERLRKKIENSILQWETNHIKTTISIGVSKWMPCSGKLEKEAMISRADKALYLSKKAGRNKVSFVNA